MGLMRKLTSAIVASSLVFGLVGSAFADYTPDAAAQAAANMQGLKIVEGREGGNLALNETITRAELVTIIVRAYGLQNTANMLKGTPSFPDVDGTHWASGNIAMAKSMVENNGHGMGMPDGSFNPNGQVTAAEAVSFLLKFLGVEFNAATTSWPDGYIQVAVDNGVITEGDKAHFAAQLNTAATRGVVFYLADSAFRTYDVGGGKTVYTTNLDSIPPVLNVDTLAATTLESKVTVSGSVNADAKWVYVNGTSVSITDGKFTADVELKVGANTISVVAMDLAGNKASKDLSISRSTGDAASIEADAITVVAGEIADIKAVVKDAKGNAIADAVVGGESTLGTVVDGKFVAGTKAGTGTVTLTFGEVSQEVNVTVTAGDLAKINLSASSVAPGAKVTLTGADEYGNDIKTGVTFTQNSPDALVDSTNGIFIASKAGTYTVTATKGDKTATVEVGVYATTVAKYTVTTSADSLIANQATTLDVTVRATDANGNVVANNTDTVVLTSADLEFLNASNALVNSVTLKNGVATVKARTNNAFGGKVAQIITAAGASTSTSASVTLVDQVAHSVKVEKGAQFLPSDLTTHNATFTITVLDQVGKAMKTGYYPVNVALTANGVAELNTPSNGSITNTAKTTAVLYYSGSAVTIQANPVYVGAAGTATVTGTVEGLASGSDTVTVQIPGPAAKLAITPKNTNKENTVANRQGKVEYDVRVTDAAGVPVNANRNDVVVEFSGLTNTSRAQVWVQNSVGGAFVNPVADTFRVSVPVVNGVGYFAVETEARTGALSFQLKDTASAALAAPAGVTANFVADILAGIGFSINGTSNRATVIEVPAGSNQLTIVAQAFDAAGNKTTAEGLKFKLVGEASAIGGGLNTDVSINGASRSETLTADATGAATFTVTFGGYVGAGYTLALTADYTNAAGAALTDFATAGVNQVRSATVAVKNNVAGAVSVQLFSDAARTVPVSVVNANENVYVRATVTDTNGRPLSGETLKISRRNSNGTFADITLTTPVTAGTDAGTYLFVLTPTTAPNMTYKIETTNAATGAEALTTIGVRGLTTPAGIALVGGLTNQEIISGQVKAFTVNLTDAHGNAVVNNTGNSIAVTLDITSIPTDKKVQVRSAADGLAISTQTGTSATATVNIAAGAQSVTFYLVTDTAAGDSFIFGASSSYGTAGPATINVK